VSVEDCRLEDAADVGALDEALGEVLDVFGETTQCGDNWSEPFRDGISSGVLGILEVEDRRLAESL